MKTVSYFVKGLPAEVHAKAKERATAEGRSLRWVILQALRLYGLYRWTPRVSRRKGVH